MLAHKDAGIRTEPMKSRRTGILFLVVGPSGAGKDTLIQYAKTHLQSDPNFLFPIRYVTRPRGQAGENHRSLSRESFEKHLGANKFALFWEAHGLMYGLGKEVETGVKKGKHVIVNVSRSIIGSVRKRFPHVMIIEIQASRQSLHRRLQLRQRENPTEIKARLSRASRLSVSGPNLITIHNDGTIESAGRKFVTLLRHFATGYEVFTNKISVT
jgi:ribose 1,5-bisphosphokinase